MFGLRHMVSPLEPLTFLDRHWGRRAVLIEGASGKFAGLFGWDDVNGILSDSRRNYEGLRLLHEKKPLPHQEFARIARWLEQGATLVINGVQQVDPIMRRFASALGHDLNTQVNINCYSSCPSKQGFDTHFDEHDVFIVQVEGEKKWCVFEPTMTFPLHAQGLTDKGKPPEAEPYIECTMTPGDVLYIPRGHWHYALAITPSVHLTVGPESRSAAEFLAWLARQLMNNETFFRIDFPIAESALFSGQRADDGLREHIHEFRRRLVTALDDDVLPEALIQWCMSTNPVRREHTLPTVWSLQDVITPETVFAFTPDQKAMVRYDPEDRSARVYLRGQTLELKEIPGELLAAVFRDLNAPLTGSALMEAAGGAGWDGVKPLLLLLYREGLIRLADEE